MNTIVIRGGVTTHWKAPDLSCFPVKTEVAAADRTLLLRAEPTYIVRGEPDPKLFDRAASYQEMKPSDLRKAVMQHYGMSPSDCPKCGMGWDQRMDDAYQKNQTP